MKHLPSHSRIALGNRRLRAAVGIGVISISPRDGRQPGAPAANESRPLGDGEPRLERPIGNLSCGNLPCGRAARQPAHSALCVPARRSRWPPEFRKKCAAPGHSPLARGRADYRCRPARPRAGVRGCERTRSGEAEAPPTMQTATRSDLYRRIPESVATACSRTPSSRWTISAGAAPSTAWPAAERIRKASLNDRASQWALLPPDN